MKKRLTGIIIIAIAAVALIGCGKDKRTDAEKLVGTWEYQLEAEDNPDEKCTLIYFSDGTGYYKGYDGDFKAEYDGLIEDWIMENGNYKETNIYLWNGQEVKQNNMATYEFSKDGNVVTFTHIKDGESLTDVYVKQD